VISATGVAGLIKGNWIKPGAIVIDVGIERQIDGSLRGDVDFDSVIKVAGWLTPVPGGVGPMTRASMLENVMEAAEKVAP
jgi:methylenetetrahydrofolate dehydrogenase (NADP+)/methenyltetrahydrofolate cyclohydrolase